MALVALVVLRSGAAEGSGAATGGATAGTRTAGSALSAARCSGAVGGADRFGGADDARGVARNGWGSGFRGFAAPSSGLASGISAAEMSTRPMSVSGVCSGRAVGAGCCGAGCGGRAGIATRGSGNGRGPAAGVVLAGSAGARSSRWAISATKAVGALSGRRSGDGRVWFRTAWCTCFCTAPSGIGAMDWQGATVSRGAATDVSGDDRERTGALSGTGTGGAAGTPSDGASTGVATSPSVETSRRRRFTKLSTRALAWAAGQSKPRGTASCVPAGGDGSSTRNEVLAIATSSPSTRLPTSSRKEPKSLSAGDISAGSCGIAAGAAVTTETGSLRPEPRVASRSADSALKVTLVADAAHTPDAPFTFSMRWVYMTASFVPF